MIKAELARCKRKRKKSETKDKIEKKEKRKVKSKKKKKKKKEGGKTEYPYERRSNIIRTNIRLTVFD